MRTRRWTDEDLRAVVPIARSVADACRRLGLSPTGGNGRTVRARVTALGLDTSHWRGRGWAAGLSGLNTRPVVALEALLVRHPDGFRGSNIPRLKQRLIAAGVVGPGCQAPGCGLQEWRGRPLTLQLDHRNGDRDDWRPENLRLLCPNCHSQTATFSGRNPRAWRGTGSTARVVERQTRAT